MTYSEVAKSPRKNQRGGLKMPQVPKDKCQLTLEVAIKNGEFAKEAKAIKRKALLGQDVVQVFMS